MASVFWDSFDSLGSISATKQSFAADERVLLFNLSKLSRIRAEEELRRQTQIAELAALFRLSGKSSVRDVLTEFVQLHFSNTDSKTANIDLISLCISLLKSGIVVSTEEITNEAPPMDEVLSPKAANRVAYLQNHFTDEAFLILTAHLQEPRAAYFSSFADVCEEVYNGLCEFCILPVENAEDGKLLRFYSLIEKFDLTPITVCDIESNSESYTRYALLRLKRLNATTLSSQPIGPKCLEISLVLENGLTLSDVLSAAEYCNMHLSRVDSLPLPYKINEYRYGLVFSVPSETDFPLSVKAFLLYLSLLLPESSVTGIYTRVS